MEKSFKGGELRMKAILTSLLLSIIRKYGWLLAFKLLGELMAGNIIRFHLKAETEEEKNLYNIGAEIIKDGKINKEEIVKFLRAFKPAIEGWIDDIIIEALCVYLEGQPNFEFGTNQKPEIFQKLSKAVADGEIGNKEIGVILREIL